MALPEPDGATRAGWRYPSRMEELFLDLTSASPDVVEAGPGSSVERGRCGHFRSGSTPGSFTDSPPLWSDNSGLCLCSRKLAGSTLPLGEPGSLVGAK